jgi:hypothetical protein
MGNETDPPDAPAPEGTVVAEDAAAVVVVDDGAPATTVASPAQPAARLPKIEVVTPDRSPPPSPPARRTPGQIVQLGRPKTKSYVN